ncbi:MAG: amylo-alpha-1,6-glucosidase [Deltaproteobacteria bacterium]|nr:amylo-alpha-1,6-glucosidase [Deltaproteobacteria bacterium]
MPEISRIEDKFYIVATSEILDPFRLILKEGDIFGVFDRFGDILPLGKNEQGLYFEGTRFLSYYELKINGARPLFLSSNIDEDNLLMNIDLTNPDIYERNELVLSRDSVHIMRSKLLLENRCLEQIKLRNFGQEKINFELEISADADFRDIFEVRGIKRRKRGTLLEPEYRDKEFRVSYEGLDNIRRTMALQFAKKPDRVEGRKFFYVITLDKGGVVDLYFSIDCLSDGAGKLNLDFEQAISEARRKLAVKNKKTAAVYTSNSQFNRSISRSIADINMMLTETKLGTYPYGGIPWFCTPFGRDGIITALECLWIKPDVAKGVLKYLATLQSQNFDKSKASEPGKILHESRLGEMAGLGEIPFGLYYGSVDSTPLFIILAGAYWRRTGDTVLIKKLWKHIEASIAWMDKYGDVDGDGFLEYMPDEKGLKNQGWKDSRDSVFHADGTLAEGPIALCEVQGYYYAAKKEAASLARLLGKDNLSQRLLTEAEELKERFNRVFWDEELESYVLALDGDKRPCRVVSSNAGHALFTGIADPEKAERIGYTLLSDRSFTGWGIRTVSEKEARYNPMSYHNGSVWPHDNAMIAFGLASYGLIEDFEKIFTGIFDASLFMEFHRLPELFCGFHRRKGVAPTHYPVACSPQTWASGSLLLMLQASLGLFFEAEKKIVIFKKPKLPEFLNYIRIKDLPVDSKKKFDIEISRYGNDITIDTIGKPGDVSILIIK